VFREFDRCNRKTIDDLYEKIEQFYKNYIEIERRKTMCGGKIVIQCDQDEISADLRETLYKNICEAIAETLEVAYDVYDEDASCPSITITIENREPLEIDADKVLELCKKRKREESDNEE
jgi:actin-like ATPase involved in cell morphogenesis